MVQLLVHIDTGDFTEGTFLMFPYLGLEEGRFRCFCKYIEQKCFSYFLRMQYTKRGHLAVVVLSGCKEVMKAR